MEGAKIRVKVGSMEIEYEGDPAFLNGGIETLLVTMGDLAARVPEEAAHTATATTVADSEAAHPPKNGFNFSTSTIAAHLEAKTGPELAICALAQLELVQAISPAARTAILAEMKGASSYYNSNMSGNLSKTLAGLTKAKRINQIGKDTYSLSAGERKQIEAKVAEIG